MNILIASLVITLLGIVLALGLSIAFKFLAIEKDKLALEIEEVLPGANCGACGYPGCSGYASALSEKKAVCNLCSPGGSEVAKKIALLLGEDNLDLNSVKQVAYIHCNSKKSDRLESFEYNGISDCRAASMIFDGSISCKNSCLQLGSCLKVCPVNAISYDEYNRLSVDKERCISCKKCIEVCPHKVISLIPYDAPYAISCNNKDKAGQVKKICSIGCIGCGICARKFENSGCTVVNFLSEIDYTKDLSDLSLASSSCPSKCIVKL